MKKLYLASRSPRRQSLLDTITREFDVVTPDIEESPGNGETPRDYVLRMSVEKAEAGSRLVQGNRPVLGADTEVVLDGLILGKPADLDAAIEMLFMLSGKTHLVYSAVSLADGVTRSALIISEVSFRVLSWNECEQYCRKYKPLDKAGAYGIQELSAAFIERFSGSYSGVMGLPLRETGGLLKESGLTD